jgi:predicted DNA-binding transcriptional regulator AlpA
MLAVQEEIMNSQTGHEGIAENDDDLLNSRTVRASCGDVSDMTLWRWQRDPDVCFPAPDKVINGRRYWRRETIKAWKARDHVEAA